MDELKCGNCGKKLDYSEQYYCNPACQRLWYEKNNATPVVPKQTWVTPAGAIRINGEKEELLSKKTRYWKYASEFYRRIPGQPLQRYSRGINEWVRAVTSFDVIERDGVEVPLKEVPTK